MYKYKDNKHSQTQSWDIDKKSSRIHAIKFSYNFVSRISLVPYPSLLFVSLQEKERRETLETTLMQSQLRSCSVNLKTLVDDLLVSQKNNWGQKAQTANILSKLQQQKIIIQTHWKPLLDWPTFRREIPGNTGEVVRFSKFINNLMNKLVQG